jgi:hypothetical protein
VQDFIMSGAAVALILALMFGEAAWLWWRRGVRARLVALALLPGALLVLALWHALAGGPWWAIAALLAASLPVHLADLAARGWLRRRDPPPER